MAALGWKHLIEGWPWFQGEGNFPLRPNSEFMQPVRLVRKPYGTWVSPTLSEEDPWGWPVSEYEELLSLRPGLLDLARQILDKLVPLGRGAALHGISEYKLRNNPYWPTELAGHAGCLEHERYVLLLPMALSQTQDDRADVRWTLFGNSEHAPAQAFWKGFFSAPGQELAAEWGLDFFRTLLVKAYEEPWTHLADLRQAGFRILPSLAGDEQRPKWTIDYLLGEHERLRDVRYLLTFRPFRDLPAAVRKRYLAGELNLLPFPGSLLFWGVSHYADLAQHLRLASQVPLLHFIERHEAFGNLRVPQSGWFEEIGPTSHPHRHRHGPVRNSYKRTFRQARVHRFEDRLIHAHEHRLAHTLFSTSPHDIGLYHKPMARNVQLWTHDYQPLLDGPSATAEAIRHAAAVVAAGGVFGYRFLFPPMQVGRHELYWHRPLVAFLKPGSDRPALLDNAPLGYLTAYRAGQGDMKQPIELWPRLLQRDNHLANIKAFGCLEERPPRRTLTNIYKIIDAWERGGHQPLSHSFARQLLTVGKRRTLEGWLRGLPLKVSKQHLESAHGLVQTLRGYLMPRHSAKAPLPKHGPLTTLTYEQTATRAFEENYWNTIAHLSTGAYRNKNNADCILDKATQALLVHHQRDLESLGDYLLGFYARLIAAHGMTEAVQFGELPFRWQTEYAFPWMGGWLHNQDGKAYERNLLVKIPGRDRRRAVIMADHYDTAYMHDLYDRSEGGTGARIAAQGADDNCSATAALMLGARSFLELSKNRKLACDVWLLHLTGEEYPAEGLGACRMCQWLVEGTLVLHTADGRQHDQSGVRIQGVYILDMVAHNNNTDRDVFQIAPGSSRESLWLASQAHQANETWNDLTAVWNRQPARRRAGRGQRSRDGRTMPVLSRHLPLHGEMRPHYDPRSTLFNTDGQAFSDFGIPVVLFMENYDINRVGYHDTQDNMTQINLDYGAALAAIAIESVARASAVDEA